jgi:hypothetical protein
MPGDPGLAKVMTIVALRLRAATGEWAATTGAWAHEQAARTEKQKFFLINNSIN